MKKYDSELFGLDDKDIKKKKLSGIPKRDSAVISQKGKKDVAQMIKDLDKEVEEKQKDLPVNILIERDDFGKVKFILREKSKDLEEATGIEFSEIIEAFQEAILEKENSTIKNVCILSSISKNNRRYLDEALNNVVGLANGVKVFADHPVKGQNVRSVRDLIGKIEHPYKSNNKVYGDLKVLSNQRDWVFSIAEQMPNLVGMSIVAKGKVSPERDSKGREQIESVVQLKSVDLVSEPATVSGLFEQRLGVRKDGSIGVVRVGKKFDPNSPVCKYSQKISCPVYSELDKDYEKCLLFKNGENCPYAEGGAFYSKS